MNIAKEHYKDYNNSVDYQGELKEIWAQKLAAKTSGVLMS
jgi:hypothetical protein